MVSLSNHEVVAPRHPTHKVIPAKAGTSVSFLHKTEVPAFAGLTRWIGKGGDLTEHLMRIVAGKFRGKQLTSPSDESIRPTADRVRESMFNILASRLGPVFEGIRVLDLFAGTGARGL